MNMLVSIDVKWSMSKHGYKLFDLTFNFDVCLKKKTVPKAVKEKQIFSFLIILMKNSSFYLFDVFDET